MTRAELKKYAYRLRKAGKSYTAIKELTSLSKSTLSILLRNVSLSSKAEGRINKRTDVARKLASEALRSKRVNSSTHTILESWNETKEKMNDPLFLLGTSLYWAEGGKTREMISFSNSDPHMIQVILQWLREYCGVPENKLRVQIHIHSLHSRVDVERHWSYITKIPLHQFNKTYIKHTSLGHRKNILYDGTCIIRVHDSKLFRKYIGWKLGLLELLGIIRFSPDEKKKFVNEMIEKRTYKLLPLTP
ncbi:hypothetical protein HY627_01580 [Candidatus Uhrbacteria bacterium]|nr:hypothetical protein [Candidatus Uhrbacteria bacterium]